MPRTFRPIAALVLGCGLGFSTTVPGLAQTTLVWTGGGVDNNWTTAANWGGVAPMAGDILVFDATGVGVRPAPNNNFPNGTVFEGMAVAAGGYTIAGNSVNLSSGLSATLPAGSSTVNMILAGVSGVMMTGTGSLILGGTNTFTGGVTIKAGTVSGITAGPSASPFGAAAGAIVLGDNAGNADATLNGGAATTFLNPIIVSAGSTGSLRITATASASFSGAITLNHDLILAPALTYTLTLSGGITGTGNLVMASTGVSAAVTIQTNPVNIAGTITNQGTTTGTTTIRGGIGPSVTSLIQASTTSALTVNTSALTVHPGGTTLVNSLGTKALTVSNGIVGTGDLLLQNNSALHAGISVTGTGMNHAGTVTNSGMGTGSVSIGGTVGANVTAVIEQSATSLLDISGGLVVHPAGTTLTNNNAAGSAILTLQQGVTGTGNLILRNNSAIASGITLSSVAVNNAGTVTNAGTGAGSVLLSAALGANVTAVTQNSATSPLTLSGGNSAYAGTTSLATGTLKLGSATALGGNGSANGTGGPLLIAGGTTLDASATTTITTINAQTWQGDFTFGGSFALNTGPGAVTITSPTLQVGTAAGTTLLTTIGGPVTGTTNLAVRANGTVGVTFAGLVNVVGTVTNSGTGAGTTTFTGGIGANVSRITLSSTTSALTISTAPLTVHVGGTTLVNALGTKIMTVSGGVNGTGNLVLDNQSARNDGVNLMTTSVNPAGTITNVGTGAGTIAFSAPVGANVTAVIQNSATSTLSIGGAVSVGATPLAVVRGNVGGSATLTLSGGVTGAGGVTLQNQSALANGITLSGASINPTGTVTNAGTGTGSVLISASLGANVPAVTQNSATSPLTLSGTNTPYAGTTTLAAGTLKLGSATSLGGNGVVSGTGGPLVIAAGTTLDATATVTLSTNTAQTWQGDFTFGASFALNTGPGAVTVAAPAVHVNTPSGTTLLTTIGGPVSGAADLTTRANGTVGLTFAGLMNVTGTVTNAGAGAGTVTLSGGVGGNVAGIIQNSATSPLTLNGTNTAYAGTTTLAAGTLKLGSATALGGNGNAAGTGGPLVIEAGTTLDASAVTTVTTVNAQMWQGDFSFGGSFTLNVGTGAVTIVPTALTVSKTGAQTVTIGGPVGGAADLTTRTTSAGGLTFSGMLGIDGTLTNAGIGVGAVVFNGGIASSVPIISQSSTTSTTTITGGQLTVHGGGTTLRNMLGSRALSVTGTVSGVGDLVLQNQSTLATGIAMSAALVNITGRIINSGTGTGGATIGGLGPSVTDVVQNSPTSPLTLASNPDYGGPTHLNHGTLISGAPDALGGNGSATGTGGTLTIEGGTTLDASSTHSQTTTNPIVVNGDFNWGSTFRLNLGPGPITIVPAAVTMTAVVSSSTFRRLTFGGPVTGTTALTVVMHSSNSFAFDSLVDITGTITHAGTGFNTLNFLGGIGPNVSAMTETSPGSSILITGPLQVSARGTVLTNASPDTAFISLTGGVVGTGDLRLRNHGASDGGIDLSGAAVDPTGAIINEGTGSGSTTIGATIGSHVTGVIQDGGSPLLLSGISTYAAPTTLRAGRLLASSTDALGDGSAANPLVFEGGTLVAGGPIISPATRGVVLTSTGLFDTNGDTITIGGAVGGAGGLTKAGAGTLALTGSSTIGGPFTLTAGTFAAPAASRFSVGGNWTNNGTFVPHGGTVTFDGAATQVLGGVNTTTFAGLEVDGAGLSIGTSPTITDILTFSNGSIITGANRVIVGAAGSVAGAAAARHVIGTLERFIPDQGAPSARFDVGDAMGYAPVTVDFTGTTTGSGSLVVSTSPGDHPAIGASGANPARSVNRWWTVGNTGVAGFGTWGGTFGFAPADLDPGVQSAALQVYKLSAGAWTAPPTDGHTATSVHASGMTSFSEMVIAEFLPVAASSTLSPESATLVSDGASVQVLTVTARDAAGRPLSTGGAVVTMTRTAGTGAIGPVTDAGDGTYVATVTAPAAAGSGTFVATLDGTPVRGGGPTQTQAVLAYRPISIHAATSTLTPANGTLPADGVSTQVLTVTARDSTGTQLAAGGATVTITLNTGTGNVGPVTDLGDGTYAAVVTAPTATGGGVFVAMIDGALVGGAATPARAFLTYAPGDPARYDLTVSDSRPVAGSPVTLFAQLTSASDHLVPVGGKVVTWIRNGPGGSFAGGTTSTDANGLATVTFTTDSMAGSVYAFRVTDQHGVVGTGANLVTVARPATNLDLTITTSDPDPAVGDTVTIVMTVRNLGIGQATQAQVSTAIPFERFSEIVLEVSQGAFDLATNQWSVGLLAPSASATLTFRGVVRLLPAPA